MGRLADLSRVQTLVQEAIEEGFVCFEKLPIKGFNEAAKEKIKGGLHEHIVKSISVMLTVCSVMVSLSVC
jgi:hypothetical protein